MSERFASAAAPLFCLHVGREAGGGDAVVFCKHLRPFSQPPNKKLEPTRRRLSVDSPPLLLDLVGRGSCATDSASLMARHAFLSYGRSRTLFASVRVKYGRISGTASVPRSSATTPQPHRRRISVTTAKRRPVLFSAVGALSPSHSRPPSRRYRRIRADCM